MRDEGVGRVRVAGDAQGARREEPAVRGLRLAAVARACRAELDADPRPSDTARLTLAVELAAEFSQAMPPPIRCCRPNSCPTPWPGAEARRLTAACWDRLRTTSPLRLFRLYGEVFAEGARDG
ncbi:hypothetical protein JNW98_15375 [Streptomyces sp. SCA2-4]|nr:hypothetical protein [Streptomyces huiliensis]